MTTYFFQCACQTTEQALANVHPHHHHPPLRMTPLILWWKSYYEVHRQYLIQQIISGSIAWLTPPNAMMSQGKKILGMDKRSFKTTHSSHTKYDNPCTEKSTDFHIFYVVDY